MKKLLIVTIGILLSGVLSAQVPFDVEKTIKVENGVEREVISEMTNVSFKLLSSLDHIKIVLENREFDFVFKSKKLDIVKYETPGEGIGGLTIYTCESEELGNVVIEEELYTMTGRVKFDRDRDGEYEEILVLHSLED